MATVSSDAHIGGDRAPLIKQNYLLRELLWPLAPLDQAPLIKQNYLLRELLQFKQFK